MFFPSQSETLTVSGNVSVTLLIKEKDQVIVKSLLGFFNEKYKDFSVIKYRTGKIGEDILVSFRVKKIYYSKVLEKFAYNDIPVLMKDQSIIEFIDEKKKQKKIKLRARGWKEISHHVKQISFNELEQLSKQGKIKEVAKEAKGGVRTNSEIVQKAKNILSNTIEIAIENLLKYSEANLTKKQSAINELLDIATDSDLKLFQKRTEMIKAGEAAIAIAVNNEELYENLIYIANNNKLENILNIRASIYLSGLILSVDEKSQELDQEKGIVLPDVIRYLNTRWLRIASETVWNKLDDEEKLSFNNLLSFIENKRKVA